MTIQIRREVLKTKLDGIEQQIRTLYAEIAIREDQIKELENRYKSISVLRQNLDDELLEKEYNALVAQNI